MVEEDGHTPPKDSTRWLLEKTSAILQIVLIAAMAWALSRIEGMTILMTDFGAKQVRVMQDVKENGSEVRALRHAVQRLEVLEEAKNPTRRNNHIGE